MATSPRPEKNPAPKTSTKKRAAKTRHPKAKPVKPVAASGRSKELTPKQQRFVDEYLIDLNATQAAIRAGYSAKTAPVIACENLIKPNIAAAIQEARQKQQERTGISADRALEEAWRVATADARELVQIKVGCCRCCYGEGHKYQRTLSEFNSDRAKHIDEKKPLDEFDERGGIGFSPLRQPHPECPECGGDGHARTVLMDTRYLSPAAAALYAGAKETKEGYEVKMHSKMDAMEKLFKHLGLYEKDNAQKTDPLTSLLHAISGGNSSGFKPVAADPEHDED